RGDGDHLLRRSALPTAGRAAALSRRGDRPPQSFRAHSKTATGGDPRVKLSIVIPVYNEERFIGAVVDRVLAANTCGLEREMVVVNDGSSDGTADALDEIARKHPAMKIFHQPANAGKGAALRRGFQEATGDFILIQDADFEYDPKDYPMLLTPLVENKAD